MNQITPAYTILSLDGGGIRGIISCKVLEYIENRLYQEVEKDGPRIAELFDLIAGTSTGGILACGLSLKGENNRPKFTAAEMMDLYRGENGKLIFSDDYKGFFRTVWNTFSGAKYPAGNIEKLLKKYMGEAKLSESITDLLITSYSTDARKPFYFKSSDCRANPEVEDFPIWEIARSTSAAPTFFPPKKVRYRGIMPILNKDYKTAKKQLESLSLIDGAVFANNPSMLAYIEALETWRDTRNAYAEKMMAGATKSRGISANADRDNYELPFLMLSIGTGQSTSPHPYEKVKDWGSINWLLPIMDILMQGVSESVHYQMQYMLPDYDDEAATPRYLRLNISLDEGDDVLDDASDAFTDKLIDYGERIVQNPHNQKKLNHVCDLLLRRYKEKQA